MTSGENTTELERMIDNHASALGFTKQRDKEHDRRTYIRLEPAASVSFRMGVPEHAMMRGISEFDRWLDKAFDK